MPRRCHDPALPSGLNGRALSCRVTGDPFSASQLRGAPRRSSRGSWNTHKNHGRSVTDDSVRSTTSRPASNRHSVSAVGPRDRAGTAGAIERGHGAREGVRASASEGIGYCLRVFVTVRIGLALVALVGVALIPANEPAGVPGWPAPELTPGWHNVFTAWERWDALWLLRIASNGYAPGDGSAAFFPLYPLLVRGLSTLLGGHPLAAALIVSNVAFLAALIAFYALSRREFDRETARRAVLYLAVFPTSLFLIAPYTESLFLLLSITSLHSARRGRWLVAGATGALAGATRSVGLLLVLPLAIEAVTQARRISRRGVRLKRLTLALGCSALAACGTLAYLAYWRAVSGDWLTPFKEQDQWLRELSGPWASIAGATTTAFRYIGAYPGGYHQLDWIVAVVAVIAAAWVLWRAPLPFGVYTWASLLIPLSFIFTSRPLMSLPRLVLPVFPIFWAIARFSQRWRIHEALIACSAALLAVMTLLFVNWYWVF